MFERFNSCLYHLFIPDGNGGKVVGEQTNCYFLFNSKLFILLVSSIVPFSINML